MKDIILTGFVKSHRLTLRNRARLDEALREWRNVEVIVTIAQAHATRSLDQNALYWVGYVHPIAEYTGHPVTWVHAYLKQKFLPKQRIEIVDKRSGVVVDEQDLSQLTTTQFNKVEFGEYLHDIEEWVLDTFHGEVIVGSNREHVA